jgi:phosphoserine phosphatase
MREGVPLSRVAFVGDSANDVWIAEESGLAVAFNPKSTELERVADVIVRSRDLRHILPHLLPE